MAEHPFTWTAGSAINVAKSCTAAIVLSLAGIYGLQDTRKVRDNRRYCSSGRL